MLCAAWHARRVITRSRTNPSSSAVRRSVNWHVVDALIGVGSRVAAAATAIRIGTESRRVVALVASLIAAGKVRRAHAVIYSVIACSGSKLFLISSTISLGGQKLKHKYQFMNSSCLTVVVDWRRVASSSIVEST